MAKLTDKQLEEKRKKNNKEVLKSYPKTKDNGKRGKRGKVIGISSDGHGIPLCNDCPSLTVGWIGRMKVPWCNKNDCALIAYFELARKCEKCRRDTEMLPKKN